MIPELAIGMLACTRIGAVHGVVFGGFSADSLRDRILDSGSKVLVTCDGTFRGAKAVPQKVNADDAVKPCPSIEKVVVVQRVGEKMACPMQAGRDLWWHEEMAKAGTGVRGGMDGRRGSSLYSLYVRFHGKAEGGHAYDGRVFGVRGLYAQDDL
jgi:acyl-coenzyme A synthetase/AMP-(fatty) acid ligase